MLFKKKKKENLQNLSLTEITSRLRGFILDSKINHGHELSVILGCPPISDELQEKEEYESDKRIERVAHLTPLFYAQAHALAEGAMEHQRSNVTAVSYTHLRAHETG
jgi:hypothetical protein